MLKTPGKSKSLGITIAAVGCLAATAPAQAGILGNFVATTPALYTYTVPAGDTVYATATGAAGGDYAEAGLFVPGGLGGLASGSFAITPGQRLSLVVAGKGRQGNAAAGDVNGCSLGALPGGYPGGGPSGAASTTFRDGRCQVGGSGGAASRVSYYGGAPLLVGGGGGGAGPRGPGGDAGGLTGNSGGNTDPRFGDFPNAAGGTQDAGGQPGQEAGCSCSYGATPGTPTNGGIGGSNHFLSGSGGAGGGEGYWGGGGAVYAGGGGGSSWTSPDDVVGGGVATQVSAGGGAVTLEYGIADTPVFTAATPPHATAGSEFDYQFGASGWPSSAFSVAFGLLPPGLSLDVYGDLHGTTTQAGTYFFSLRAANPRHSTDTLGKIVVDPAAATSIVSPGSAQTALGGTAFASTLTARVVDAYGNGVPGVALHYALPAGATARFASGGTTVDATTDAGGWTDAGVLNAGRTPGPLPVTVSSAGLASSTIDLTVSAGAVRVLPTQIVEGNRRTHTAKVMLTLDRAIPGPVTVGYYLQGWSALAGEDFVGQAGTVTFAARKNTAVIKVTILSDRVPEEDETVQVFLQNPVGATIATGEADLTILNDD
jgi:hypothetical protein